MKEILRSKSFWTGIASIATGVGLLIGKNYPEGLQTIIIGLSTIFIREGIRKETRKVAGK